MPAGATAAGESRSRSPTGAAYARSTRICRGRSFVWDSVWTPVRCSAESEQLATRQGRTFTSRFAIAEQRSIRSARCLRTRPAGEIRFRSVGDRDERVAHNQTLFRELNERLREITETIAPGDAGALELFCECGRAECMEKIRVL